MSYHDKKKFRFFLGKGQNRSNFFFHQDMTIFIPIESPSRVDTRYAVFKDT